MATARQIRRGGEPVDTAPRPVLDSDRLREIGADLGQAVQDAQRATGGVVPELEVRLDLEPPLIELWAFGSRTAHPVMVSVETGQVRELKDILRFLSDVVFMTMVP